MSRSLRASGIRYLFLGDKLGGRPSDPVFYVNGQVQYSLLASAPTFQEGLNRLRHGIRNYRVAVMCAERDPLVCHRAIVIARALASPELVIQHIIQEGVVESHAKLEERLLQATGHGDHDFFTDKGQLLESAYASQATRIAFRAEPESWQNLPGEP